MTSQTDNKVLKRSLNQTSSDEEDDYMNMDLAELEKEAKPVKAVEMKELPYSKRRALELEEQKIKGYNKPLKEIEEENRQKALDNPIPKTNKGFQLLQKMGFKGKGALGEKENGLKEPIKINIRTNMQGLGVAAENMEKLDKLRAMPLKESLTSDQFKTNSRSRFMDRQLASDWYKSRIVCEQLDRVKGIEENPLWSPYSQATKYEEAKAAKLKGETDLASYNPLSEALEPGALLDDITDYLRTNHFYCLWCGEAFKTKEELVEFCPGKTSEDH